jgi:hypothetical protein
MKKVILLLVTVILCGCQTMMQSAMGFKQEDGAYKIKYDHFSDTHVLVRYYGREHRYIDIELRGYDEASPNQNHFILTDANNNVLYNDKGVGGASPVYSESFGSKMTGYGQALTYNINTSYQGHCKITLESEPIFPLTLKVEFRRKDVVKKEQIITIRKR